LIPRYRNSTERPTNAPMSHQPFIVHVLLDGSGVTIHPYLYDAETCTSNHEDFLKIRNGVVYERRKRIGQLLDEDAARIAGALNASDSGNVDLAA
jgi:hypothetical protein